MGFWDDAKSFIGFNEEGFGHHPHAQHPHQQAHPQQQQSVQAALRPAAKKVERAPIIHFPETHRKPVSNQQHQLGENVITEIVVFEPRVYEDTLSISSHLKSGRPIIVNLKNLDAINGKRLIDFVCGTAYAFDGKMQKIGPNIFLFTPPLSAFWTCKSVIWGRICKKNKLAATINPTTPISPLWLRIPPAIAMSTPAVLTKPICLANRSLDKFSLTGAGLKPAPVVVCLSGLVI
jgi:FtsZ-interacting cell division protein YlmF